MSSNDIRVWGIDPTTGQYMLSASLLSQVGVGILLGEGNIPFGSALGGFAQDSGVLQYDADTKTLKIERSGRSSLVLKATGVTGSKLAHSPGGEVSSAALGGVAWTNLHRMRVEDDSGVGASPIYAGSNSQWLLTGPIKLRDAGVPVGATISGFRWRVRRLQTNANGVVKIRDLNVSMFLNGSSSGDNKADTVTDWPTSYADKFYGGSSDMWGLLGLINEEDEVQLAVLAQGVGGVLGTAEVAVIDYIELEVFYSYTQTFEIENSAADGRTKLLANGVEVASVWPNGTVSVVPRFSGARVYRTTDQVITTNGVISFDAIRYNRGQFDPSTPTRLTAMVDGLYDIRAHVFWSSINSTTREVQVRLDGTTTISERDLSLDNRGAGVSTIYYLKAGQYVELFVAEGATGTIDVDALPDYSPEFMMHLIGV